MSRFIEKYIAMALSIQQAEIRVDLSVVSRENLARFEMFLYSDFSESINNIICIHNYLRRPILSRWAISTITFDGIIKI